MIPITLQQLAVLSGGQLVGEDNRIEQVTTDTRALEADGLFVALIGERYDGHQFAEQALAAGAKALLVSRQLQLPVPQVVVADTRLAFGQLAAWVRQQLPTRVVGLTGSSGKTSVKEMTAAILKQCGETLYTAGNLNNDLGVPITLLRLTPQHRYAVIEMGANHQGEIAYTTGLVKPEAALVNNLAAAHLEGFGSLAGVAQAKGEIFQGLAENGVAILNGESHDLPNWHKLLTNKRVMRFSAETDATTEYRTSAVHITPAGTQFQLHTPFGSSEVLLPLPGRHNIANALAAAALAQAVGAPLTAICAGLAALQAVPGRLYPIALSSEVLILDDTYNANVGSMIAAAKVLADMPGYRIMVAGDMAELGEESEACHREVGQALHLAQVDKVLTVGHSSHWITEESQVGEHLADKAAVVTRLTALLTEYPQVTILIKGSRSAAMEEIVAQLREKVAC